MAINKDSPLSVTIVGAGLGGLSCAIACHLEGFKVQVFDQVKEFLPIGDSIGFGSNSARLFNRWGVGDALEEVNSHIKEVEIYNFDSSDKILGYDRQLGEAKEKYGCISYIGRRCDFHLILVEHCKKLGIPIHMGTTVSRYDSDKPSIVLENGAEVVSDVVICADGVKSQGRKAVLGYDIPPVHSGYAIFRGFADAYRVGKDPLTSKFSHGEHIRLFVAPDIHCIVTTLQHGKYVNVVLTHKDEADIEEGWNQPGKKEDVLGHMNGWDPSLRRLWEMMENIIDWKLIYRPCLPQWISKSGLVAIMGDAAHPFLPSSIQGASQAIEDGAAIARCLSKISDKSDIPVALNTFFNIRHDYVAKAQSTGIEQRDRWHNFHDKESMTLKDSFDVNRASQNNYYLWENDIEKVVDEKWKEVSDKVR